MLSSQTNGLTLPTKHSLSRLSQMSLENENGDSAIVTKNTVENRSSCQSDQSQDISLSAHSSQPKEEDEKPRLQKSSEPLPIEDVEALRQAPSGQPLHSVFSKRKKQFIVFMTAWAGLFSAISANIYFPALNTLSKDLNVSSGLINLTLTTYMIFQGLAPAMYGDLADVAGRRPAYFIGFVIYIAANIGLATQNSFAALLILRCLQSSGSSGTIALANGIVGDIATPSERGKYMAYVLSGAMIGPPIGPILGGVLSQFLGWRAIFWFLAIMAVVFLIPFLITFPETGRNVVGNGSIPPQGWNMSLLNYLETRKAAKNDAMTRNLSRDQMRAEQAARAGQRKLRFPNPLNTLSVVLEKDVGMLLFYNSLIYTAFYDVVASIPYLFADIYGFNDLQVGLCFIPFGVGGFLSMYLAGRAMDYNYKRIASAAGISIDKKRGEDMKTFPIEKARLQVVWPFLVIGNTALLCYGWAMQRNAPLAVPLVLTFIMGLFLTIAFNVQSTMLVDFYPQSPATAAAANNLVRCLMGAGGTAVIIYMIDTMGRGWCFTFIALVVFAFSPLLLVMQSMGPQWREERRLKAQKQEEEKTKAPKGDTAGRVAEMIEA